MKAKQKEPTEKSTGQSSQLNWRQMNRKQRRDLERKIQSADLTLQLVHPDAAGIDIGNESHYVAVPPDRDSQPVQYFGCTTAELRAMADWLKQCRIRTVAMQSTSVYWIAVYDVLEQAGLEVYLVNARETKNLPGRKSDVQESQWLMKLHTYGLLRNSFRPPREIRMMRTYWRQRNVWRSAARHIQRIQKTLTQMNNQSGWNQDFPRFSVHRSCFHRRRIAGRRPADRGSNRWIGSCHPAKAFGGILHCGHGIGTGGHRAAGIGIPPQTLQFRAHVRSMLVTKVAIFFQRAIDDVFESWRKIRIQPQRRRMQFEGKG
jgi:Transposase